jgi:hypothetical protein
MEPYAGVDYNLTFGSNTLTMGNPMPESTLTLCQSQLYFPVRALNLASVQYCIPGSTVQTFLVPVGPRVLAFGLDLEGLDMTDTFRGVTHRFISERGRGIGGKD